MARADPASLIPRLLSAIVLAPLPIAAIWFGWPWLPLLVAVAAAVLGWEWARLCRGGEVGASGAVLVTAVVAATGTAALWGLVAGLLAAIGGAALVWSIALICRDREPGWIAFGGLWVALPCVLLLWLAGNQSGGRIMLLWMFAVVWATDIGAYAVGRRLGGPRLAPRWSPGKTWAGLIGGAVAAAVTGWITGYVLGISPVLPLVMVSTGLAVVEQFGDLAESMAKRRFGVKDSSGLIPGHGGLLDRVDGLLAVIPVAALLTVVSGGGVLSWR
ncbi:MAG TPA: phosphatidate cytidylyltransferase [Stellaceae bacterium]|nr:phosphatidate cytidylyltransferase [Stellaceae bacterium]